MRHRRVILFSLFGVVIAVTVGLLLLWALGYSALEGYAYLLEYSLLSRTALFSTLSRAALLVLLGLSASTAFASGALNLGQSGQFLIGAMAATVFGLFVNLPAFLQIPLSLAVAALAGMLYASIAAFFRRRFNMNELIVTLMLNFVADYFTQFLIAGPLFEEGRQSPASPAINASGWFPVYKGFDTGILVALLAFILIYLLWNRSKTGYEWTIMGQNSIFSRIGGCPNEENFTKAMLVSGALAALAGALVIMGGIQHRFMPGIKANYADDGIMIAIVANNKVVATAIYAIMFAIMRTGAMGMELETGVPLEFVHVLTAITVLFVVASREYSQYLIDRFSAFLRARGISSRIEDYAGRDSSGSMD